MRRQTIAVSHGLLRSFAATAAAKLGTRYWWVLGNERRIEFPYDFRHFLYIQAFVQCLHKKTRGCQGTDGKTRSVRRIERSKIFRYIDTTSIFDTSIFDTSNLSFSVYIKNKGMAVDGRQNTFDMIYRNFDILISRHDFDIWYSYIESFVQCLHKKTRGCQVTDG